jgi:hypothetical protein
MTLLTLRKSRPVEHTGAKELFEFLKEDFADVENVKNVKLLFRHLDELKHRADISDQPGRRWNAYKAAERNVTSLLEAVVSCFNKLNGRVHNEERHLLMELLKLEGVLLGRKGHDHHGRTLYCLHTTKGSIPLDQPLGITHHALLQRKRAQ